MEKKQMIKWEVLEELSKSREIFDFSIDNTGLDFNSLYEHLDEFSFLNSKTIRDIS